MKVNKTKQSDDKIVLEVTATADDVNRAFGIAEIDFANSMGLTPEQDKTIEQVAEEKMGITNLDSIIADGAFEMLIPMAIDKAKVIPAYPPQVNASAPLKRNQEATFIAEVTLKPEYELTSYDPVEITIPAFTINEAEVDAQIQQLAERNTTYRDIEPRPLEKGDACLLAIKCFEDGKELTGITTDARTYVSGEGFMPEDFDKNIIGMVPGETREFTFEAPGLDEEYNPITTKVEATVTLKAIQEANPPVIDDEWIANYMPMYKSVEDLRGDIRKSIEARDREQYENYKLSLVANALADRFEGSIADEIYMNARDNLVKRIQMDLARQGKSWEDFVQENGGEQQLGMMLMLQTRENVIRGFVLDAAYRHSGRSVTDADIDAVCRTMNPQMNPKQIRQELEAAGQGFILREAAERLIGNKWAAEKAIVNIQE